MPAYPRPILVAATFVFAPAAMAQPFAISWWTVDGGGAAVLAGGTYSLGCTSGQPDAGPTLSGGLYSLSGGLQAGTATVCYANCDSSLTVPILNVLDFACFLNRFAAGDTYANCDNSSTAPVLNVLDFACFLNAFATGCP